MCNVDCLDTKGENIQMRSPSWKTDRDAFLLGRENGLNLVAEHRENKTTNLVPYQKHIPQAITPHLAKKLGLPKDDKLLLAYREADNVQKYDVEKEEEYLEDLSTSAKYVYYDALEKMSIMDNQATRETAKLNAYLLASHLDQRAFQKTAEGKPCTPYQLYENGLELRYEDAPEDDLTDAYFQSEDEPKLVAYHNTTAGDLSRSLELGGFPLPSLAVTRSDIPYTKFGDITLVGTETMGSPEYANVYSVDGYTVTVPKKDYPPIRRKGEDYFWKTFDASFDGFHPAERGSFSFEMQTQSSQNFFEKFLEAGPVQRYYLEKVKGVKLDYQYMEFQGVTEIDWNSTAGAYNLYNDPEYRQWAEHQYEKIAGEPRIKVGRKFQPYTLENVTKVMLKKKHTAVYESAVYGTHKTAAALSKRYRTMSTMRKDAEHLLPVEELDKREKVQEDLCEKFRHSVSEYYDKSLANNEFDAIWDSLDEAQKALAAVGRNPSKLQMAAALEGHGFRHVPDEVIDLAMETHKVLQEAASSYFEAKPQRAVKLSEFKGAIVPKDTSKDVLDALKGAGLDVREYDPSIQNDRGNKTAEFQQDHPEVLFQSEAGRIKGAVEKRAKNILRIFKDADESTCLHELSHTFLIDLERDARWEQAHLGYGQSMDDLETVKKWGAFQEGDSKLYEGTPWAQDFQKMEQDILETRKALADAEKKEALDIANHGREITPAGSIYFKEQLEDLEDRWVQERFARAFEQYVQKGKAPNRPIQKIFDKFKSVLRPLYHAFNASGCRANKKVEAVMGRMLGSDPMQRENLRYPVPSRTRKAIDKMFGKDWQRNMQQACR